MNALYRVVVKELLQLREDKRLLRMMLVAPVIQLLMFGFAVNTDVKDVPIVVVDQARTAASRELIGRFLASGFFVLAGHEEGLGGIDKWLVSGRAQLAIVIRGHPAAVQVIADGGDSSAATVALGYASSIIAAGRRGRVSAEPRVWYNPDLLSRWFYVPSVLAMILMMMTMLASSMGIVREREIGTMEQLLVTPLRPWQLIVGKLLPFGLIGVIQLFLVTAAAVYGFGVPLRGSLALLLGLTLLFLLNTLGLGLLVSTVVANQQQAMMVSTFLVMLPMIYLSGLMFPIENMPPAIQAVTYLIPVRYYAIILRGIFLKGSGLAALWPEALAMGLLGTGILALAALRFEKRLD